MVGWLQGRDIMRERKDGGKLFSSWQARRMRKESRMGGREGRRVREKEREREEGEVTKSLGFHFYFN